MSPWKVGSATLSDVNTIAASGVTGLIGGAGVSAGLQHIEAFGFWAAAAGSRLGLAGMDYADLGKSAVIGTLVGAVVAGAVFGVDKLRDWRSKRDAEQSLKKTSSFNF